MGFMKALNKTLDKCMEYAPKAYDFMEKAQERAWEKEEQRQKKQQEIEGYRADYSNLNNKELKNAYDKAETNEEKTAAVLTINERNAKFRKYKEEYSGWSAGQLEFELGMIERLKHKEDSNIRMAAIKELMKEQGMV